MRTYSPEDNTKLIQVTAHTIAYTEKTSWLL